MGDDFLIEKRLIEQRPDMSNLVTESAFALKHILKSYTTFFPEFTDHSIIHSLNVVDYCNKLIGEKQAAKLNADECYVLLMACYLHDSGMAISKDDYEEFSDRIEFDDYFKTHDPGNLETTIRDYHHEYSGLFIRKYRDLFEIPSDEHLYAIVQVARGHRKTDLFDETEYPDIRLASGNIIHTPYLAAVLRLGDDLDVAVDRVPELLFDISRLTNPKDIEAFGTHHTIRNVSVTEDAIILHLNEGREEYLELVLKLGDKISDALRYCADVCAQRSPFLIGQNRLVIEGLPSGR